MRFRIRDVLWLIAVVAVSVGWSVHYRSQASLRDERDHAVARVTRLTDFLESRGLDVFMDKNRIVVWRKDGKSLTSVADAVAESTP